MKWMIASDLHGSAYWCEKMIERYWEEKAGKLLLLGDILYHGPAQRPAQGLRAQAGDRDAQQHARAAAVHPGQL